MAVGPLPVAVMDPIQLPLNGLDQTLNLTKLYTPRTQFGFTNRSLLTAAGWKDALSWIEPNILFRYVVISPFPTLLQSIL